MAQRQGAIEPTPSSSFGILIHAASVGEVQAAQALMAALRAHWPDHAITVTTQTPTGKRAAQSHWGNAIQHLYFPIDTPGATSRFLDRLQPSFVVLIEREVWPEWLLQCRARAIPVALVNARLSEKSAASYQKLRYLMAPAWHGLSLVAAADPDSARRLRILGVPGENMLITGNLKFDQQTTKHSSSTHPIPLVDRPIVVAGSTHEGEESAFLDAWPTLLAAHPNALLVIVPRHPERFNDVARQIHARNKPFARRSLSEVPDASTSIWLGDTMGELAAWYAQSSLCFIGGTLVQVGGHNPLEAMALGKPVVFGPYTENAELLYDAIVASRAGQRIDSAAAALAVAAQWLAEPTNLRDLSRIALAFVNTQQGSSESTLQTLKTWWQPFRPTQLPPIIETREDATTVWHNPNLIGPQLPSSLFDPQSGNTTLLATGSGRGQAKRLTIGQQDVVMRHYRRGGLVARLNPDRYRSSPARESRAMREYALLRWMSARGLPVPIPIAARQRLHASNYTADIIVGMIPGTHNLVQCLTSAPLKEGQWRAVGRAIRQLHDAQVFHADLNAHNILLDHHNQAWIVDFDKCETRSGDAWKAENLKRLNRSLRKESDRLAPFHWRPESDALLHMGYGEPSSRPRK